MEFPRDLVLLDGSDFFDIAYDRYRSVFFFKLIFSPQDALTARRSSVRLITWGYENAFLIFLS